MEKKRVNHLGMLTTYTGAGPTLPAPNMPDGVIDPQMGYLNIEKDGRVLKVQAAQAHQRIYAGYKGVILLPEELEDAEKMFLQFRATRETYAPSIEDVNGNIELTTIVKPGAPTGDLYALFSVKDGKLLVHTLSSLGETSNITHAEGLTKLFNKLLEDNNIKAENIKQLSFGGVNISIIFTDEDGKTKRLVTSLKDIPDEFGFSSIDQDIARRMKKGESVVYEPEITDVEYYETPNYYYALSDKGILWPNQRAKGPIVFEYNKRNIELVKQFGDKLLIGKTVHFLNKESTTHAIITPSSYGIIGELPVPVKEIKDVNVLFTRRWFRDEEQKDGYIALVLSKDGRLFAKMEGLGRGTDWEENTWIELTKGKQKLDKVYLIGTTEMEQTYTGSSGGFFIVGTDEKGNLAYLLAAKPVRPLLLDLIELDDATISRLNSDIPREAFGEDVAKGIFIQADRTDDPRFGIIKKDLSGFIADTLGSVEEPVINTTSQYTAVYPEEILSLVCK